MGSGYFEADFPLVLEEFSGRFLVVWAPKWSLEVSHGQDLVFVNEWLDSKRFQNSF